MAGALKDLSVSALERLIQYTDGFVCTVTPLAVIFQCCAFIFLTNNSEKFNFGFSVLRCYNVFYFSIQISWNAFTYTYYIIMVEDIHIVKLSSFTDATNAMWS